MFACICLMRTATILIWKVPTRHSRCFREVREAPVPAVVFPQGGYRLPRQHRGVGLHALRRRGIANIGITYRNIELLWMGGTGPINRFRLRFFFFPRMFFCSRGHGWVADQFIPTYRNIWPGPRCSYINTRTCRCVRIPRTVHVELAELLDWVEFMFFVACHTCGYPILSSIYSSGCRPFVVSCFWNYLVSVLPVVFQKHATRTQDKPACCWS